MPALAAPGTGVGDLNEPLASVTSVPVQPPQFGTPMTYATAKPVVSWPAPASAVVALGGASTSLRAAGPVAGLVKAGGLPVRLGSASSVSAYAAPADDEKGLRSLASTVPAHVKVEIVDRTSVVKAVSSGTGLRVTRADGGTTSGRVRVEVDYSGFSEAFGGNYGSRLVLVQLPACVLSTPDRKECQTQTPVLTSVNNAASKTVSADVDAVPVDVAEPQARSLSASAGVASVSAPVYALASSGGGPAGDFKKTSLSESGSWTSGDSGGGFSYSYPLKTPKAPAGPQPNLSLSYSSAAIDGMTNATSGQGSPVGAGWDLGTGFVERTFVSCADEGTMTGDLCMGGQYYSMSLGGKAGALVQDDTSHVWHMDGQAGWKVENVADYTGSMVNGGQWKVTTADGTQYFFGHRVRYAGDAGTHSEQSVPVVANQPLETCYNGTDIKVSTCWQNYRWNLDYVVDTAGNSMTYFYTQESQKYGIWNNYTTATYHRGAVLHHIEYGTRAGHEGDGPAPYRVDFGTTWRCAKAPCAANDQPNFPDVPWDQYCDVAMSSCATVQSPTFWVLNKIVSMTAKVYDPGSSTYKDLDFYDFPSGFPTVSDGTSPSLWLESVTHTGYADGNALTTPTVNFFGTQKNNRADYNVSTGSLPMVHYRVDRIWSETGAMTTVTYSGEDCAAGQPMPDPDWNTRRCFPQYWKPQGSPAGWAWWQKYVATQVTVTDSTGGTPTETWTYGYSNDNSASGSNPVVLWGHNNAFLTPLANRTWSDWRGYSQVVTTHGVAGQQPQTSVRRYYRGMNGDRTDAGWGTRTMTVWNSEGTVNTDWENLRGQVWEDYSFDNGTADHFVIHDLWGSLLSTQNTGQTYRYASSIQNGSTRNRTHIQRDNTWRVTSSDTQYDAELFPSKVIDRGDNATTTDDVCSTTTYNRNLTNWIMSTVSQAETYACPGGTIPGGAQPLSGAQTYYDGAPDTSQGLTTAPTIALPTRTKVLDNAAAKTYTTTGTVQYDTLGRPVSAADALGRTTTTAYTPTGIGAPTQLAVTTPPPSGTGAGFTATTTIHPITGQPVKVIDANGKKTEVTYDPLGRLISVWSPGRDKATATPNVTYSYSYSKTTSPVIKTSVLGPNDTNGVIDSYEILDSRFRPRQTQEITQYGVRHITDTVYDMAGRVVKTSSFKADGAPSGTLAGFADTAVQSQHRFVYDDSGRVVADELWGAGNKFSQVATAYDGDSVTTTPPTGGTASTAYSDGRGRTTTLRQFLGSAPSGSFQDTTYGYDLLSRQTSSSTAGSTWTTAYNIRGQVESKTDPDTGLTKMTYTAVGQVETTEDAESRKLLFKYDDLDRKTEVHRKDDQNNPILASWTYDTLAKGQLTSSTRFDALGEFKTAVTGYDDGYRPLGSSVTIPKSTGVIDTLGNKTYTTSMTYMPNGAPRTVVYPAAGGMAAETVNFGYNTAGQQISISGLENYLSGITYYFDGGVFQTIMGSGTKRVRVTTARQDVTQRLLVAQVSTELHPGAQDPFDVQYTENYSYDVAGNVLGINDATPGGAAFNQCFGYDGLRRMTESWTTSAAACQSTPTSGVIGGTDPYWTTYGFDTAGNRSTELKHAAPGGGLSTDTLRTYYTPGAGQPKTHSLTKVDTKVGPAATTTTDTFAYDNTGNTTLHNGAHYTWNELGKLSKLAIDSGPTTDYVYDADGNRILRKDSTGVTIYAGSTELHANTPTSTPTAVRTYPGAVRSSDTEVSWIVADHHGTSQTSIKSTDLTVTRRRTDPFGGPRGTAVNWPTQRGFVDGVNDPDTKLVHIGARDYDPSTGRFMSVDPQFDGADPQSWNGYTYANNAPATSSDPSGLGMTTGDGEDNSSPAARARAGQATSGSDPQNNVNRRDSSSDRCYEDPQACPGHPRKGRVKDYPDSVCDTAHGTVPCVGDDNRYSDDLSGMGIYADSILAAAAEAGIDPLLLFAILLNESCDLKCVTYADGAWRAFSTFKTWWWTGTGIWSKEAGPSIGVGQMKEGTFEKTRAAHYQLADVAWSDLDSDDDLAIRATAFRLKDLDRLLPNGFEGFTEPGGVNYSRDKLVAYGYNAGDEYMVQKASGTGGPLEYTHYIEMYSGNRARADQLFCRSGYFACG
ncbi:RHS repeat domain-containing protein [Longispora fulva]|uniref:RHS repeat-associated protein n=1 Tax=Longispora fulva TaxID=619741 RepID=A0A8J7GC50_9ACTN|nr:RHS repeat-associated core domain-containing protein [Longispora fulva]MBG6137823.1 RHS repeat-associated protein [Longispora fulva]